MSSPLRILLCDTPRVSVHLLAVALARPVIEMRPTHPQGPLIVIDSIPEPPKVEELVLTLKADDYMMPALDLEENFRATTPKEFGMNRGKRRRHR